MSDLRLAADDMDARLPDGLQLSLRTPVTAGNLLNAWMPCLSLLRGLWDCIREIEDKEEMQRAAKRFTNKAGASLQDVTWGRQGCDFRTCWDGNAKSSVVPCESLQVRQGFREEKRQGRQLQKKSREQARLE